MLPEILYRATDRPNEYPVYEHCSDEEDEMDVDENEGDEDGDENGDEEMDDPEDEEE